MATNEGALEDVIAGKAAWCVVHGDALHVLRDLPDACVDAFVTDPPHSSSGAFRGDRVKETTVRRGSGRTLVVARHLRLGQDGSEPAAQRRFPRAVRVHGMGDARPVP